MSDEIADRQSEMRFIGSLFLNNDLFLEHEKSVTSKYYFADPICKTLYEWMEVLYANEQKFTEKNFAVYASKDDDRLKFYKSILGGWNTIEDFKSFSDETEFKSYFQAIEKFALLRALDNEFIKTDKIRSSKNFEKSNSAQIYNYVKMRLDKIQTKISSDAEVVSLTERMSSLPDTFLEKPNMGIPTFMPSWNLLFRGFRERQMIAVGMPGNQGKTRFLTKIIAYHTIIQGQRSLVMLNEMSEEELKLALLVTCINNEEFKQLHGIDVSINERELSLGQYLDDNGEFIDRKTDGEGEYNETVSEFRKRVLKNSSQYRGVLEVSRWVEEKTPEQALSVINVSRDYSDAALETIARKNARKGYDFIGYDNLKSGKESIGDYSGIIKTTTMLSEVAKSEGVFAYASIQLTPDSQKMDILELSSMNIASAKGLKDVLDVLDLSKEIDENHYSRYKYIPTTNSFGKMDSRMPMPLPVKGHGWKLYGHLLDKNRAGSKECILVQTNLNTNQHIELGILVASGSNN